MGETNPESMQEHAQAAANLLKALANENRLMILCTLISSEMSVGELNARVPLSQSAPLPAPGQFARGRASGDTQGGANRVLLIAGR